MENVILIVNLVLALALIGVVLLQRSEGGGLGSAGGGAGGGVMSGRAAATALSKITWILAAAFLATSMALTIIAAKNSAGASVLDRLSDQPAAVTEEAPTTDGTSLLPPSADSSDLVPTLE